MVLGQVHIAHHHQQGLVVTEVEVKVEVDPQTSAD